MKVLYIDETGDHSLSKIDKSYPIFMLSGVIVDEDYHNAELTRRLDNLKLKHFGRTEVMLHNKEMTHPQSAKSSHYLKFMSSDFRQKFYADFEEFLSKSDLTIVACAILKNKRFSDYGLEAKDPYILSFETY